PFQRRWSCSPQISLIAPLTPRDATRGRRDRRDSSCRRPASLLRAPGRIAHRRSFALSVAFGSARPRAPANRADSCDLDALISICVLRRTVADGAGVCYESLESEADEVFSRHTNRLPMLPSPRGTDRAHSNIAEEPFAS